MSATIIEGTAVARESRARTAARVRDFVALHGAAPALATVLVGGDPASEIYVRNKRAAAAGAGFADFHRHLDSAATQAEVEGLLDELAADDRVAGILLQLPLPPGLDRSALIDRVPPGKDVDGLTTLSQGQLARGTAGLRPCTPSGIIELLDVYGVPIEGASAVVVGKSELVGHPAAELLLRRGATVTIAHSRTHDLAAVTSRADIVVAAAGMPGLITAAHIKPGAAVIDVGIHRTPAGLVGDVRFDEVALVAGFLTPVPGGVGPMTIATLLSNTILAADLEAARRGQHL
ncbi:MAG: Bifunctional protein FolD [Subtercola sp.]|nr:Bifunctional protein FolD [Subtercola sp.]